MKPRVVLSLLTKEQDYQQMQATDARSAAMRAGFDLEVIFADSNPVLQIQQLFGYIHVAQAQRPTAIVLESVAGDGMERVARSAAQAGIGWILLSSQPTYIELLRKECPGIPICEISCDQTEIGRIQARHFRALLPKGGRIVYIEGPRGSVSTTMRRQAVDEDLRGSNIVIEKTFTGDWTTATAERVVSSWLRVKALESFRPDLVGSQNDSMAMGAHKAMAALGAEWARIPLTGCDGLPNEGQRLVKEGLLAATVVKQVTAGKGIELIANHLHGQPIPPRVLAPPSSYPSLEELSRSRR